MEDGGTQELDKNDWDEYILIWEQKVDIIVQASDNTAGDLNNGIYAVSVQCEYFPCSECGDPSYWHNEFALGGPPSAWCVDCVYSTEDPFRSTMSSFYYVPFQPLCQ